jgi:uncharacterized OB-fold protein
MLVLRSMNISNERDGVSATRYLKPLYAAAGTGSDRVVLQGGACACGHLFFPMQTYGCERCGRDGEALESRSLDARGTLVASARVHRHADKSRPTPFTVVEIRLEAGPTVRSLLAERAEDPEPGAPMHAVLEAVGAGPGGEEILDLRFVSSRPTGPAI